MHIRPYQPSDLAALKRITSEGFSGVSIDHGIEQAFGPINGHDWRWRKERHIDADVARELPRRGGRYGLATMCVGVGQGVALAMERTA